MSEPTLSVPPTGTDVVSSAEPASGSSGGVGSPPASVPDPGADPRVVDVVPPAPGPGTPGSAAVDALAPSVSEPGALPVPGSGTVAPGAGPTGEGSVGVGPGGAVVGGAVVDTADTATASVPRVAARGAVPVLNDQPSTSPSLTSDAPPPRAHA